MHGRQHWARARLRLLGTVHDLYAACLAATAGQYLGLDSYGSAECLRRLPGLRSHLSYDTPGSPVSPGTLTVTTIVPAADTTAYSVM